jgi:hypothetical protein
MADRIEQSLSVGGRNIQDIVTLVAGALLLASPWALGYLGDAHAAYAAWVGGAVVVVISIAALIRFAEWMEWLALVVGAALILAPWYLGFVAVPHAVAAQVVIGSVVVAASISELWTFHRPAAAAH